MLVTISGPPGSGKSTVADSVAQDLGYEHISGGDIFRSIAEERGMTLKAFNALAEEDESIDRNLDRELRETARTRDDVVLESRLAGWMAGDYADLRVWLDAPLEVRAERIAHREGIQVDESRRETQQRESSEKQRYQEYYDINFDDRLIYDVIFNTARWSAPDVATLVVSASRLYDPEDDEGSFPVTARYEF